jgi:hypothetical protein
MRAVGYAARGRIKVAFGHGVKRTMARPKPLADLLDVCLGPALAAQGFAASDVIVAWPDIVGERLAKYTQPLRIDWGRKGARDRDALPEPATIVIRVESAFALEMQHLAPVLIERINAHYGWRCIGRLVLKQGPVRRAAPEPKAQPTLSDRDRQSITEAVGTVGEDALREALGRLGQAVLGAKPDTSRKRA